MEESSVTLCYLTNILELKDFGQFFINYKDYDLDYDHSC